MSKRRPLRQRARALILLVSWLLFPLTIFYFSPYLLAKLARSAIVESSAAGVINGGFIVFGLMLLAALVFGLPVSMARPNLLLRASWAPETEISRAQCSSQVPQRPG